MRIRTLAAAAVLSLAVPLALPADAEAGHRHSRSCGHRYYESSRYDRGYYDRGYDRGYYDRGYSGYRSRGYRSYGYGYRPSYRSRYYYAPPPGYYYHRAPRYRRPHFSIHLDF